MSHQLLDSISEEEGDNLLPMALEDGTSDPVRQAKSLTRDINSLVMRLEQSPLVRPVLDQFSKDGELLKQASKSQACELVWAEVRSDILSFYNGVRCIVFCLQAVEKIVAICGNSAPKRRRLLMLVSRATISLFYRFCIPFGI